MPTSGAALQNIYGDVVCPEAVGGCCAGLRTPALSWTTFSQMLFTTQVRHALRGSAAVVCVLKLGAVRCQLCQTCTGHQ
jgi:hypothetical protein